MHFSREAWSRSVGRPMSFAALAGFGRPSAVLGTVSIGLNAPPLVSMRGVSIYFLQLSTRVKTWMNLNLAFLLSSWYIWYARTISKKRAKLVGKKTSSPN
jgi:hypothetical protein